MYLVCHKCAAAYLVDDNLIVRGDERAQCPNCLHVQPVLTPTADPPPPPTLFRRSVEPAAAEEAPFRIPSIPPVGLPPSPPPVNDALPRDPADEDTHAATCPTCGARMSDAFDRALGICERCRTDAKPFAGAVPEETQVVSDKTVPYEARPPQADGLDDEPLAAHLGNRPLEDAEPPELGSPPDEDAPPKPRAGPPAPSVASQSLMNAAVHSAASWRPGRIVGIAVALAAFSFAGAALVAHRRAAKEKPAPKVALSPRLEKTREQWRRSLTDLRGTGAAELKQGDVELAQDTLSAYARAERSFQAAFVLDADGSRAVAGYLQSVAWGRGKLLPSQELDELVNLGEAAELQWGRSARILLAHACLALLRPQPATNAERARSIAQEALGLATGPDKALAHLVLSSAFLSSSAELAIENADLALKLNPALRRAYFHRAVARESLGDYRAAVEDLQSRLSLDPDEPSEAKEYLARIYQEVGEWPLALALYRNSDESNLPAITSRAVILYQSARKPQRAAQELIEGLRRQERAAGSAALLDAWVHLAAAERVSGKADEAVRAAQQALAISSGDPAAHLQLFLLALARGAVDEAALHLKSLRGRLGDPALEKVFEGRLSIAAHRDLEAMRSFAEAAELDPRRVDALLWAGAAAASAGRRDDAWRYLVLVGQADPSRTAPSPVASRFYVLPEENLAGAEERVIRMAKGSTEVTPRLYEALVRFHQRDLRAADKLLGQVVDIDTGNALAHALRALIALDRGSVSSARSEAERAAALGRGMAVAHFAYGRALVQSGRAEEARAELGQAEALAPGLLAAQVQLAHLEAKMANAQLARARLLHVLRVDPSYLAAKRALYALER